jgi:hypothetical protein
LCEGLFAAVVDDQVMVCCDYWRSCAIACEGSVACCDASSLSQVLHALYLFNIVGWCGGQTILPHQAICNMTIVRTFQGLLLMIMALS